MKILYAIQGTGNGHLTRAMEILPYLKKIAKVDVLVSGTESTIKFPFDIDFQYKGMSFVFGENGGIDYWKTFQLLDTKKFIKSVFDLPTENYNLVINDFEPISAWSSKYKNVPCVSLSHQCAVLNNNVPKPLFIDPVAYSFLKLFAPADKTFGFHFQHYDNHIYTPIIREQVRKETIKDKGHISVYLPSYADEKLQKKFSQFPDIKWEIFSKHIKKEHHKKNISFIPVSNKQFIKSMATSSGVLCGSGFETPAEALYLKKKLLVIPMKGQFEQECNAYALEKMGVMIMKNLKQKRMYIIDEWLESKFIPDVEYKNEIEEILETILETYID